MPGVLSAAACLPVGFGVALATGVRPLGGIVLVALAGLAGHWSGAPFGKQAAWYLVVALCFAASHVLADPLGRWGAVALVTAVATAAYVVVLRRAGARAVAT